MTLSLRPFVRFTLWTLLALTILVAILLTWMWFENEATAHPLPFEDNLNDNIGSITVADNDDGLASANSNTQQTNRDKTLHIIASPNLKNPLDKILNKFEIRYPNVTPILNYINEEDMKDYVKAHPEVQLVLANAQVIEDIKDANIASDDNSIQDIDAPDQTLNSDAQQQLATFTFAYQKPASMPDTDVDPQSNQELLIQGYAIDDPSKDTRQDSALISFRQFILASSIQRLVNSGDINSIESYKNSVIDLFNPNGQSSTNNLNTDADNADNESTTQDGVFLDAME